MSIPIWLTLLVAAVVSIFGVYRIWIAISPSDDTEGSRWDTVAAFGRTKRAHLIYGILYLAMGVMLCLAGFGVKLPFLGG